MLTKIIEQEVKLRLLGLRWMDDIIFEMIEFKMLLAWLY